nr:MAG TPA: hypothetical protein [Caudoviricetes sp.]
MILLYHNCCSLYISKIHKVLDDFLCTSYNNRCIIRI